MGAVGGLSHPLPWKELMVVEQSSVATLSCPGGPVGRRKTRSGTPRVGFGVRKGSSLCSASPCRSSDEDGEEESAAQGNRQTHDNLYRVHMPSLYSCGSSYGSETSIPAAAHTVSNAPVTEYM